MRIPFVIASALLLAVLVAAAPADTKEKEKEEPATKEQRKEVQENLKKIVLAMHDCESADRFLPHDILDANKKPLLSWRVQLLPYLGEKDLYKQFKLDEAWDSDTNKKLIEKMPKAFAPTRVKAEKGETFYRGFAGTDATTAGIFQSGKKLRWVDITDGTSNTIALIDAGEPVIWTKPGTDLDPVAKEFPKLGKMIDGDFYCAMADGSVRQVKRKFDVAELKKAISRGDGLLYDDDKIFAK